MVGYNLLTKKVKFVGGTKTDRLWSVKISWPKSQICGCSIKPTAGEITHRVYPLRLLPSLELFWFISKRFTELFYNVFIHLLSIHVVLKRSYYKQIKREIVWSRTLRICWNMTISVLCLNTWVCFQFREIQEHTWSFTNTTHLFAKFVLRSSTYIRISLSDAKTYWYTIIIYWYTFVTPLP